MEKRDWPADDYAIGSYIQATVADFYLNQFHPEPTDAILDIGCGDGSYSVKILKKIPHGTLTGIDASDTMLKLAEKTAQSYPNFKVQKGDALSIDFSNSFDAITSFWCLQWTNNIPLAFEKIFQALKPGGQIFIIFPSGDDAYIKSYQAVKASNIFSELEHFTPPVIYTDPAILEKQLLKLPFTELNIQRIPQSVTLPDLSVFQRFINGIGFYQGQIPADKIASINEAMVQWYDSVCKSKYKGQYQFNFSPFYITGKK